MKDIGELMQRITQAYAAAANRWCGCDWTTTFGRQGLELQGMHSRQIRLLAEATSGPESQAWTEASVWLQKVEQDAKSAQSAAAEAVELMAKQDSSAACRKINEACQLESLYRKPVVWGPLRDLIAAAVGQFGVDAAPMESET